MIVSDHLMQQKKLEISKRLDRIDHIGLGYLHAEVQPDPVFLNCTEETSVVWKKWSFALRAI